MDQRKAEIKEIGKKVKKAGGPHGIFSTPRKIRVNTSNIPYLGDLIKAMGMKSKFEFTVDPATRRPPTYEVFMARWFM